MQDNKEASCIIRGRLSCKSAHSVVSIHFTNRESKFLQENSIISLEDLITVSEDDLENLKKDLPRLHEEIKDIQTRFKNRNDILIAVTKPRDFDYVKCKEYFHWLPLHQSRLLRENDTINDNSWEGILADNYKEFNTLVHASHINTAETIFQENHFKTNQVYDNSIFSKVPGHPNNSTKVIWFGPGLKKTVKQTSSRYGNVAFFMDTLDGTKGLYSLELNYYFLEV